MRYLEVPSRNERKSTPERPATPQQERKQQPLSEGQKLRAEMFKRYPDMQKDMDGDLELKQKFAASIGPVTERIVRKSDASTLDQVIDSLAFRTELIEALKEKFDELKTEIDDIWRNSR